MPLVPKDRDDDDIATAYLDTRRDREFEEALEFLKARYPETEAGDQRPEIDEIEKKQEEESGRWLTGGIKAAGHGLLRGTQGFWQLFDDAAELISRATGWEKGGLFKGLVNMAEPPEDWTPKDLSERIVSGIVAAGPEIGKIAALPGSAPITMGYMGAIHGGAGGGWKGAGEEAAKGVLLGNILHGAGILRPGVRVPSMAGIFGTQAAAEGGGPEDIAESATVGGVLGVLGRPGRTVPSKRPKPAADVDQNAPVTVKSAPGGPTDILHAGGREFGRYAVVELDNLVPSHLASQSFIENPAYPKSTQERLYHTSKDEQLKVIRNARTYNPMYTINSDPTLVNGPPAVTPEGIVLGGNSRIMSLDLVYRDYPVKAESYRQALETEAENFGIDPAELAGFQKPVLVRVLETAQGEPADLPRLVRLYNQPPTASVETKAEGVSKARLLSEDTVGVLTRDLEEFGTLREYLASGRSREFISNLLSDGVLDQAQLNKLISSETGLFTEDGKRLAEQVIRGKVFEDAELLNQVPAGVLQKLDFSLPALIRLKARGGAWDITPQLQEAMLLNSRMKAQGFDTVDQYVSQLDMFSNTLPPDPVVLPLWRALNEMKPLELKAALSDMAAAAAADVPNQATFAFYKPETSREAFERIFGTGEEAREEMIRAAEEGSSYLTQEPGADYGSDVTGKGGKADIPTVSPEKAEGGAKKMEFSFSDPRVIGYNPAFESGTRPSILEEIPKHGNRILEQKIIRGITTAHGGEVTEVRYQKPNDRRDYFAYVLHDRPDVDSFSEESIIAKDRLQPITIDKMFKEARESQQKLWNAKQIIAQEDPTTMAYWVKRVSDEVDRKERELISKYADGELGDYVKTGEIDSTIPGIRRRIEAAFDKAVESPEWGRIDRYAEAERRHAEYLKSLPSPSRPPSEGGRIIREPTRPSPWQEIQGRYPDDPAAQETQLKLFHDDLQRQVFRDITLPRPPEAIRSTSGALPREEGQGVRTLGLAIADEMAKTGRVDLRGKKIRNAQDLAALAQVYRDPRVETLRFIYVKDGEIVAHEGVTSRMPGFAAPFVGKQTFNRFVWAMKERMKRLDADGYYLLHNHPTGNVMGSAADANLTRMLAEKVPGFKRHIIIDSGEYMELYRDPAGEVWGEKKQLRMPKGWQDPLFRAAIPHQQLGRTVVGPREVAEIGRAVQVRQNYVAVIYRDSFGAVRAIQEMPVGLVNRTDAAAAWIRGQARRFGATGAVLYTEGARLDIAPLIREGVLLDAVWGQRQDRFLSVRETAGIGSASRRSIMGRPAGSYRPVWVSEDAKRYETSGELPEERSTAGLQGRLFSTLGDSNRSLAEIWAESETLAREYLKVNKEEIPERAVNIALANIRSTDDVKFAIAKVGELALGDIEKARRGKITHAETLKYAEEHGMTLEELLSRRRGQAFNPEEITGARMLQNKTAEEIEELARKIKSGQATDLDKLEFQKKIALHAAVEAQVSGAIAEAGRTLSALRIIAGETPQSVKDISELMHTLGGTESIEEIADQIDALPTRAQRNKLVRDMQEVTTWDMFFEVWINALLSGPQTHAVNILSNSLAALWQVPERLLASELGRVFGTREIREGEALAQAYGMIEGAKDGLRLAWQTLKSGESADPLGKVETRKRSITGEALHLSGTAGRAADLLGEGIRIPSRMLDTTDVGFKGIGYRMELHARAFRQAAAEGLEGEAMAKRIREIVNNPPRDLQMASVDAGRYVTFTNELEGLAKSLQTAAVKTPALRIVLPFIRTPMNVIRFAVVDRTPLGFASARIRADIQAGGARRELALSRIALGSMVLGTVAALTAQGMITGGGPIDQEMKKHLRSTGWQPYSVKIGDRYVSFARLEPLGVLLGLGADMAEIIAQAEEHDADELAAAGIMAISRNITSKTYLRGVSELMETISDPERYGDRYIKSLAGTVVPSAVASLEKVQDPVMRDARSVLQQIQSRIPYWSESLPVRRNLWGEPLKISQIGGDAGGIFYGFINLVNPVYVSGKKSSPVDEEIIRLGVHVSMPSRQIEAVPLTPQEYDRYVELAGNAAKNPATGLGLKDTLERLLKDPMYQRRSGGPDGGKAYMIKDLVRSFRELAREEMFKENRELRGLVMEYRQMRARQLAQ